MGLEFSSASAMLDRMSSDHLAHLRSFSMSMGLAIARRLDERIAHIDGRQIARTRISGFKARKTAAGSTGYSLVITQPIARDLPDLKRKQILAQQDSVRNQLASKNGVLGLLSSVGVR